jgi:glutamine cyclotransferase
VVTRPSWLSPGLFVLAQAAPVACTTTPSEPASRAAAPPPASPRGASSLASNPAPSAAAEPRAPASGAAAPEGVPRFPHDVTSFTEGLVYDRGSLFESTGLYGESKLRKVDLASGKVLAQVRLTGAYFGEGLALLRGELFQLTYREGRCFVYDAGTLEKKRELRYDGEGWGLTTDGAQFVMSDGTPTLTFRDAVTFQAVRTVTVTGAAGPVANVNELEWVDGFVLANVWGTNDVIRIDPASGRVVQTIDLAYLPEPRRGATEDDVLNGIAYDPAAGRLFVTGKRWSNVFQIPRPWK